MIKVRKRNQIYHIVNIFEEIVRCLKNDTIKNDLVFNSSLWREDFIILSYDFIFNSSHMERNQGLTPQIDTFL
jgi:hypothetical protein